jgi:plastocyanin
MFRQGGVPSQVSGFRTVAFALLLGLLTSLAADRATVAAEVVRIGTLPGLRYDISEFSVRPGTAVELVFSNYDEMLHNLVITRPGARERVVQAALALGPGAADRDFVPPSPDVLWATAIVQTGQGVTLRFTAPTTVGNYPYVCTMPGHGIVMFGTMVVTNTPRPMVMTPVEPPAAPAATAAHGTHNAAPRALVARGFMPNAGPAAISVQLPGGVSYVWDAGAGRFRYAWAGGIPTLPSSPERGLARISGEVFYREPAFPLRLGTTPDSTPALVEFKGYTIDAAGIPEFETLVDGVTVRERAEVRDGRFVRRFRVSGATTVWFVVPDGADGVEVSGGVRAGASYRLNGAAAQEFVVTHAIPGTPAVPGAAR